MNGGWAEFATAYAAFLLSHAVPARPAARGRLTAALGERGYLLAYSAVSLAALVWLIAATERAPPPLVVQRGRADLARRHGIVQGGFDLVAPIH
jgi:hypothetical protein